MRPRNFTRKLIVLAAILVTMTMALRARAAVSKGPLYTNAVVAEEQRILLFFQAEQSFQEQLKVGRERYAQKQATRAKVIAAMSAQLQARQKTVVLPPLAASFDTPEALDPIFRPWLGVIFLASCMIGAGFYLKSQCLPLSTLNADSGHRSVRISPQRTPSTKNQSMRTHQGGARKRAQKPRYHSLDGT
jgi:hypothetical protein